MPLIQHVYDTIAPLFDDLLIVSNRRDSYPFLNVPVVPDIVPGLGPIGGLCTALRTVRTDRAFMFGCDMPKLNPGFIRYMGEIQSDRDVLIPSIEGYHEPLHAIYSKQCLPVIEKMIADGSKQVIQILDKVSVRYITADEIRLFSPEPADMFFNINYKDDLE